MSAARRSIATTDPDPDDVLIVGGGIAGLATARAMMAHGRRAVVLEQAPSLREFGAGLQVTPNGARVLAALGARPDGIAAQGVEPWDGVAGRRLARFPAGPGYAFVHRGDLLAALAEGVTVATGQRVAWAAPGRLRLADGAERRAGLVVGADGIHSVTRAALGETAPATFTGQSAWRAVVQADHPPVARIWMLPGGHVVSYPLTGGVVNLVAVRDTEAWAAEGWTHPDDPSNLRAAFARAAPVLRALLDRVEATHRWGLFRHPVATRWAVPGLALVGDAAHPTLPFLAQGANLALEDAWVLASRPLATYTTARLGRVTRAVDAATGQARAYHMAGPARLAAGIMLRGLDVVAPGLMHRRFAWLHDADVTSGTP